MKIGIINKTGISGIVERRLFDSAKLAQVKKYLEAGFLDNKQKEELFNWAAKPQFADNWLWKLINKTLHLDLQIPFITGNWTLKAVKANMIVDDGLKAVADQLGGTTTAPQTAIAIGIGATAADHDDAALGSEITTYGGERGAATVSNQTTTVTGDTERWIKTFSFTAGASFAVTEEGILSNNTSGGVLLARQVFAAVNVVAGDSLQITHNIQVTTA